jgi:hypothetical protein
MMQVIIDRFEGQMAVCEKSDRTMMNIDRNRLPSQAKEGDVLIIEGECIRIDAVETARKKAAAEKALKDLFG